MHILLVDNGTSYLHQLTRLLKQFKTDIYTYTDIIGKDTDRYDLVILSGGHRYQVMGNEAIFQDEIHLIQKRLKPLIGICLGYELIVRAYSGELIQLPIKEKGVIPLTNIVNSPIFYELPNFNVYESHRWVAKRLPDSLVGLAKSNDGYEVVQHVSKPHMGFQFHPEMCIDRTCGNDIFLNAIHYLGLV